MKWTVIKYGGSLLDDAKHQSEFLAEAAALSRERRIALVHGGGKAITQAMETAGLETRFVQGRRFTDDATMKVVEQTLGEINARIVSILVRLGVSAKGFSGRSEHLMSAHPVEALGLAGDPAAIRSEALDAILAQAELPVFFPVAEDFRGRPLNINADDFALALAASSQAERLVFLTGTGGILDGNQRMIQRVTSVDVERLIVDGTIKGGMAVKARACVEALRQGVGRVEIAKNLASLFGDAASPSEGTSFLNA